MKRTFTLLKCKWSLSKPWIHWEQYIITESLYFVWCQGTWFIYISITKHLCLFLQIYTMKLFTGFKYTKTSFFFLVLKNQKWKYFIYSYTPILCYTANKVILRNLNCTTEWRMQHRIIILLTNDLQSNLWIKVTQEKDSRWSLYTSGLYSGICFILSRKDYWIVPFIYRVVFIQRYPLLQVWLKYNITPNILNKSVNKQDKPNSSSFLRCTFCKLKETVGCHHMPWKRI